MQEFRPSRFQVLPPIVKNIIIISGLVFFAQNTLPKLNIDLYNTLALHTWQSQLFKPWQIITHIFMHASITHLVFNMLAIWMIGSVLENLWGPKRFLIFFITCGLGAAFAHLCALYVESSKYISMYNFGVLSLGNLNIILNNPTVGASGAVFGCLAAFAYLFPNTYLYFYFFFPIKAKWFVFIYGALELYLAIQNSPTDPIAHIAHLGGGLMGFLLVWFWNKNNKQTFY
jgi:membrane associated rhomboid family serine protease